MGSYVYLSKIGEGTFSEVFKVRAVLSGRLVALKQLKRSFRSRSAVYSSREIKALKSFSGHPNIIQLLDILYESSTCRLSLVFELMHETVYDFIKERVASVPLDLVRRWVLQLLLALEFMHNMGVFHRDIKPENLMVTGEVLKVTDLGSCQSLRSNPPHTDYISTRWYRAPECLLTNGYYSYEMDIWATGCVMYEIMTLKPLFPGDSEIDQIDLIHQVFGTHQSSLFKEIFASRCSSALQAQLRPHVGTGLRSRFSAGTDHSPSIDLLSQLLQYDYRLRISASSAINHRYFANLRESFQLTMYVILL